MLIPQSSRQTTRPIRSHRTREAHSTNRIQLVELHPCQHSLSEAASLRTLTATEVPLAEEEEHTAEHYGYSATHQGVLTPTTRPMAKKVLFAAESSSSNNNNNLSLRLLARAANQMDSFRHANDDNDKGNAAAKQGDETAVNQMTGEQEKAIVNNKQQGAAVGPRGTGEDAVNEQGNDVTSDLLPSSPEDDEDSWIPVMPTEEDHMFSMLPPHLTAFFSGIFSENHHAATTTTSTITDDNDNVGDAEVDVFTKISPESPTTVDDFDDFMVTAQPLRLETTHSLFLEDQQEQDCGEHAKTFAAASWDWEG